jgi:hypothetical protein
VPIFFNHTELKFKQTYWISKPLVNTSHHTFSPAFLLQVGAHEDKMNDDYVTGNLHAILAPSTAEVDISS